MIINEHSEDGFYLWDSHIHESILFKDKKLLIEIIDSSKIYIYYLHDKMLVPNNTKKEKIVSLSLKTIIKLYFKKSQFVIEYE